MATVRPAIALHCVYPLYAADLDPDEHPEAFTEVVVLQRYSDVPVPPERQAAFFSLKGLVYSALAAPRYDKPQGVQSNFYLPQQTY